MRIVHGAGIDIVPSAVTSIFSPTFTIPAFEAEAMSGCASADNVPSAAILRLLPTLTTPKVSAEAIEFEKSNPPPVVIPPCT